MKRFGKEWFKESVPLCAAAVVVAVLAVSHESIIWKLSQQTLFFADFEGLRELVSTLGRPGGVLDWVSRGVQVSGLGSAAWLFYALAATGTMFLWRRVFSRQRDGLGILLSFPSVLLPLYPALLCGTALWMLDGYAGAFRNTFGLWIALGIFALARRTRPWIAALLATLLFPWFGYYPLIGALGAGVWCLPVLLVPALAARFLYHDLSLPLAYMGSGAILDRMRLCSLNVWTCGAFVCFLFAAAIDRRHADPLVGVLARGFAVVGAKLPARVRRIRVPALRGWMPVIVGVALVAGLWRSRPMPDLRGQMSRERAVVACRWEDVLRTKPRNGNALRMESAYRILALQRLGRLPEQLFDEPIWSTQDGTQAQEDLMDGHELLFAFGLLLPARRTLFETMVTKGWMPRHFQILGDIALLFGERALAERNYRLLLRCPFYRDTAKARLALLTTPQAPLPKDLADVALFARTITAMLEESKITFFDLNQNAEQLIYNHFVSVKNCDEPVARFCLACMLLKKQHNTIAQNTKLLEGIFGGRATIPPCIQQAILVSGINTDTVASPVERQRWARFNDDMRRAQSGALGQDILLSRWASTYFFYHAFIN